MITGQDRNEPLAVAHLYEGDFADPGRPYCVRGWNRDNGKGYSIFRNNVGESGVCLICQRRYGKGLAPIESRKRKTKYL